MSTFKSLIEKIYKIHTAQNIIIVVLFISSLTVLTFINLSLIFYSPSIKVQAKEDFVSSKIAFWEDFLINHPTYFEGWIELSNLQMQKGLKEDALLSYKKAVSINPNSEKLYILQLKLGS